MSFQCPVAGARIAWAAKDLFNPGAVVHDGKVCLLVRAEDGVGRYAGTSRIGLATSSDGYTFELEPEPVLAPGDDRWQAWEWPGGCEDPRVVESPDGGFVCTYTAFDGKVGCLFVATSPDLRTWMKHGPAFAASRYVRRPTKAGSILTRAGGWSTPGRASRWQILDVLGRRPDLRRDVGRPRALDARSRSMSRPTAT